MNDTNRHPLQLSWLSTAEGYGGMKKHRHGTDNKRLFNCNYTTAVSKNILVDQWLIHILYVCKHMYVCVTVSVCVCV